MAAASDPFVGEEQVEDQAPSPGRILKVALDLHVAAPLACAGRYLVLRADRVSSYPEERTKNSDGPVVRFGYARVRGAGGRVVAEKVHPVLLTAAQGGPALVAAGEGGEHRHLQARCRADKRLPQRLIASIIGGRGPEGPEP